MKKKNDKKIIKKKWQLKLKAFFSSWNVLVIALIIFIAVLLYFNFYLMGVSKTYLFEGKSEYVDISNGVISTNYTIDLFEGSDIDYVNTKDETVVKYKIGYVIKKDSGYKDFTVISGEDSDGYSLKGLINEMTTLNIKEPSHNKKFFSKSNLKKIQNNLYFIIEATSKDGKTISDITKVNVSKISK